MTLANQPAADHRAAIENRLRTSALALVQVKMRSDFDALPQAQKDEWFAAMDDFNATVDRITAWADSNNVPTQNGGGFCRVA